MHADGCIHILVAAVAQGSGLFTAAAAGIATVPRASGAGEATTMEEEEELDGEGDDGGGRDVVSYDDI